MSIRLQYQDHGCKLQTAVETGLTILSIRIIGQFVRSSIWCEMSGVSVRSLDDDDESYREAYPHLSVLPPHHATHVGSTLSSSPLSPSITPSLFHFKLKTYFFLKSFPP